MPESFATRPAERMPAIARGTTASTEITPNRLRWHRTWHLGPVTITLVDDRSTASLDLHLPISQAHVACEANQVKACHGREAKSVARLITLP